MSQRAIQGGDSIGRTPGTSTQPGNSAPRFGWKSTPVGRVVTNGTLLIAYGPPFGLTDDVMAARHQLPPVAEFARVFTRTFPWFQAHYDAVRAEKAVMRGYTGPMDVFGPEDAHNRLRYMFVAPGKTDGPTRAYGVSHEHPRHTSQSGPGGLWEVWLRCSTVIEDRILRGQPVTMAEALEWGAGAGQPSLL